MKATSTLFLEEINSEEKKHFESFINQLGTDNVFEDKSEIWKIWVQLWEAEPHLLGNLKEFLAKMTHFIKEAEHEKEKIRLLLKIQISDHNKKVQTLYEEMEQQIEREKQKLQNESKTRSQLHYMAMQEELDVREQEIQHSLIVQKELETQLLRLKEKQLVASTQAQQLQQIKSSLENQLQQTVHQLQKIETCLDVMKDRISQLYSEGRFYISTETICKGAWKKWKTLCYVPSSLCRDRQREGDTNKVPHSIQDPVNFNEMICSQQEVKMEYILNEDKMDSSIQQFQNDSFEAKVTATIGMDYRIKNLFLDSRCFALRLWDTAGQERYHSVTKQFFRKADGVVLMYDITSEYSFIDVRYWLNCVQEGAGAGVVVLLLGNKMDCSVERRVSVDNGAYLAKVYGLPFYECSAASGYNVTESIVQLVRLMKTQENQLKKKALDLPVQLKNKRSCCL
ncbi:ras-related protein Rab-44 isoform X2 [Crotalus tigris]|uniref:ras-related protein Rab-44 isoform X2 n=1 Tax=Crotalus tigris TaxID=88082 RepID=UPI00192F25D7|nr:ras-related protein Rab-44 isoform X2 [Crotalus tigris]